jgi:hypothetical membrane protein
MVPWWGVVSAAAAPVLLAGGWTVAAARQPRGFDPVVRSISSLAAQGAADRWIMTLALALVGVCHLTTAAALAGTVAPPGRALLAAGGAATGLVAAFPLGRASETPHELAAGFAFLALAAWPALSGRGPGQWVAAVILLALVGWFFAELASGGTPVGLAERAAALAQTTWPFLTVVFARRSVRLTAAGDATS